MPHTGCKDIVRVEQPKWGHSSGREFHVFHLTLESHIKLVYLHHDWYGKLLILIVLYPYWSYPYFYRNIPLLSFFFQMLDFWCFECFWSICKYMYSIVEVNTLWIDLLPLTWTDKWNVDILNKNSLTTLLTKKV